VLMVGAALVLRDLVQRRLGLAYGLGAILIGAAMPIACGGCAIFPEDIVVADDDGAVVIPKALADFVAQEGAEHELMETWLVQEVEKGAKLPGLYPPNEENEARYEAWKKSR
jgi:hypothetical protein